MKDNNNTKFKKGRRIIFERRRELTGYIFLSPWLFGGIFLLAFPLLFSLSLSFSKLQNYTNYAMKWVGLDNYKRAFFGDIDYTTCIIWIVKETLINTPMIIIFSIIAAILISRNIKGRGFFRSIFFLPVLLGTGYVMKQMMGQGVNNSAMEITRELLLTKQVQMYLPANVFNALLSFLGSITTVMWHSGVQIILFLVGIQKIPIALYESARVDSATEWEMFWKITLPMLSPIILLNIVYTIIASFSEDSPLIDYIMYRGFNLSEFEYASAMGWSFFAFIFLVIAIVFLIMQPFIKRVVK